MLTLELMGLLALGILWVNTLLVAGAALTPLGEMWSRLRRNLRPAEVTAGNDDGVVAAHVIEQVGRKAADDDARQAILFHDCTYRSELAGGALSVDGETIELTSSASKNAIEVWVSPAERKERAEAIGDFDTAYKAARKAKGYRREVRSTVRVGQQVWFAAGTGDSPPVLATFDPRSFLRGRIAMVFAFQLAMVALSGAATFLALYPPVFGTMSTVGGVLGLVHFLLVMQPLGVTVREACLLPHVAVTRGSWVKTGSEGTGISAEMGSSAA